MRIAKTPTVAGLLRKVLPLAMLIGAGHVSAADLVITNARLFAGTGAEVQENVSIAVTDGRIEGISATDIDTTGARVIDAAGKTVMPGLVDVHIHLFFALNPAGGMVAPRNDAQASDWIDGRGGKEFLATYLDHGFTSIASPIDFFPPIAEVRDRAASGELKSPRVFIAGGVFVAPGGHYTCIGLTGKEKDWCEQHISVPMDTEANVRAAVRRYAEQGVDFLSLDAQTNAPTLQLAPIKAMIDEANKYDLPVQVHTSRVQDVKALVDAGVAGFLHPPGGHLDTDGSQVAPAGDTGLPVGMSILIGEAKHPEIIKEHKIFTNNLSKLINTGSPVVYATGMPGATPDQTMPIVFTDFAKLGMSNADILLASTRDAALSLLRQPDLGTLEPGKIADIIIVDGDPLADLTELYNGVKTVIKAGKVVVEH